MDNAEPVHNEIANSRTKVKTARASSPEKIRAELNIEKWPAIWQPSKSKHKPSVRTLKRETRTSEGTAMSELEIGFTQHGTLTTEDQKMFYALIKQWEENGRPASDVVFFSDRLLSRLLKKKWGTNVIDAITGSLRRLRLTPLTWKRSYHRSDTPKTEVEEEIPLTLLSDLRIIRRKVDGHVTNQQGYFQFDRNLLSNLLAHFTKPLLIDELFRFKSEIAQLIYVHIDLILASKNIYERRTKELFDDLGLKSNSYQRASNRKQLLAKAIAELQGARLSTGVLRSVTLEKTKDSKDYKIVFRKTASSALSEELEAGLPAAAAMAVGKVQPEAEIVVNRYTDKKQSLADAEHLVQYFYERFHSVTGHVPQLKELRQATSLIGQHGLDRAKHIINYAFTAAPASKYQPQTFGGILQYTSRGVADYDALIHSKAQGRQAAKVYEGKSQREQRDLSKGECRFAALTAEQRDKLFARLQAELFEQHPFLATVKRGSAIQARAIQNRMIEFLQDEPMDLLPIAGNWQMNMPQRQNLRLQASQESSSDTSQPLAA